MAYVVARKDGRFEIRESVHTDKGPRARTLANLAVLSEDVLDRAAGRSSRPFDRAAVLSSAIRRGTPIARGASTLQIDEGARPRSAAGFVDASRRFAVAASGQRGRHTVDGGNALIDLIGFAEEVARHQPRRPAEPLRFPPLGRLIASRCAR